MRDKTQSSDHIQMRSKTLSDTYLLITNQSIDQSVFVFWVGPPPDGGQTDQDQINPNS